MKKKNYYWSFMIAVIMVVMSVGFVSCGGDDEEVINGGVITKIDPVQERLKPFIGLWEIKANDSYHDVTFPNYDIFFFQDNKCVITERNHRNENDLLSWDYDESNKYLSIAGEAKGQWQITSVGDDAWTGLALWYQGNNAYSAQKMSNYFVAKYHFENAEWMCDTIKAYVSTSNSTIFYVTIKHEETEELKGERHTYMVNFNYSIPNFYGKFTEDKENDIYECEETDSKGIKGVKIQIVHPYSYKDVYMNIAIKDKYGDFSGKFLPQRK